jgi:hypothetical protein
MKQAGQCNLRRRRKHKTTKEAVAKEESSFVESSLPATEDRSDNTYSFSPSMGPSTLISASKFGVGSAIGWTVLLYSLSILFIVMMKRSDHVVVIRECPSTSWTGAHSSINNSHQLLYDKQSKQIAENWTDFLANFRNSSFDSAGKTYLEVKADLSEWKVAHYVPYLQSGDVIFESACGVGINLILTLEILQEHGLTNIRVEGSDILPNSVNLANRMLHDVLGDSNHLVCVGDSTNLNYIPNDSYDLVFTGFITPLDDPLGLNLGYDLNLRRLKQVCPDRKDHHIGWKDGALHRLAQLRQEVWFGGWVGELVRIAKPGAPIIVEQVSPPFCEADHDWGGVSRDFWSDAISRYRWDVDPSSLELGDDHAFDTRYHVFMRKAR